MAKLTSLLQFKGSLDNLTAYPMEGVEGTVVRKRTGPTKEQIQTEARFANINRINKETTGRSVATGFWLRTLGVLRPVVDQSCCGRFNGLVKVAQEGDTVSPWGQRHVALTGTPGLLEGFNLRQVYPLESIIRNPLYATVNKATLSAEVPLPALLPGVNFFSPPGGPLFRVVATLGVLPDLYYGAVGETYFPPAGFRPVGAQSALTEWYPVKGGSDPTTLSLQLPEGPGIDDFSLLLTVGVQWATIGWGGRTDLVKKVKSARIERVV